MYLSRLEQLNNARLNVAESIKTQLLQKAELTEEIESVFLEAQQDAIEDAVNARKYHLLKFANGALVALNYRSKNEKVREIAGEQLALNDKLSALLKEIDRNKYKLLNSLNSSLEMRPELFTSKEFTKKKYLK